MSEDKLIKDKIWRTASGKEINVCDLTDIHIEAIVNCLIINDFETADDWIDIMIKELQSREEETLNMFEEI